MVVALRAFAALALAGISLLLFTWQIVGDWTLGFVHKNLLEYATRLRLLSSMATVGIGAALAGASYVSWGGQRAIERLSLLARVLAPFTLIAFVPALLMREAWEAWSAGIAITCFTLLFERLLRVSLAEIDKMTGGAALLEGLGSRRHRRLALAVVFAGAALYAAYMSKYTLFAHRRFQTYGYDLGQYDNIFANTFHGRPFRCTPLGASANWSAIANHADLSVVALLPFYAIYPHAEALLVLQSVILGAGAIPLYLFAARHLRPTHACALALSYLLYPPMHGANFYDFHFQPVASTFVLFTIWLVDARRWFWCALSFVLAICCREDISVGLTVLGVYLVMTRYRPKAGFVMAVAGATYFVVMRFVIMPMHGGSWFQEIYKDLYPLPDGPRSYGGVMLTLLTNPSYVFRTLLTQDKLRYFLQIMAPVAFLPLRRSWLLPALVPGTLFTLLTTAYPPTTDIGFQYSGHFTSYIFCAAAVAIAAYRTDRDGGVKQRSAVAALVVGTLFCTIYWGAFTPSPSVKGGFSMVYFTHPTAADDQKARDLAELDAMVPEKASVAVSENEMPHVSGRFDVRTLRDGTSSADYLLYGLTSPGASVAAKALADGDYVETATRPGLALLRRKGL